MCRFFCLSLSFTVSGAGEPGHISVLRALREGAGPGGEHPHPAAGERRSQPAVSSTGQNISHLYRAQITVEITKLLLVGSGLM